MKEKARRSFRRYGWWLLLAAFFFLPPGLAQAVNYTGWRLDGEAAALLPHNFRSCRDAFAVESDASRDGLDALKISGSAQPPAAALPLLYARLREEAGETVPIYLVDLRQESHRFVNDGVPVSWYEPGNRANLGCDAAMVRERETAQLAALVGTVFTAVPLGNTDTKILTDYSAEVFRAVTEETAAQAAGFRYARFSAADQRFPDAETVDAFLRFYQTLPEGAWLHFHCHAGHGRTTTFMVFCDILRNPDVAFADIVERQYAMGGTNLLAMSGDEEKNDRALKLYLFYEYVAEQRAAGFAVPWSVWLAGRDEAA